MSEQVPIDKPNSESDSNPFHVEYTKKIPSVEGKLERFFQRVNQFFKREAAQPTPLQGRIHELQFNADTALADLLKAKEELEKKSDDAAFLALFSSVLDPFIKEISRIQRAMDQDSTTAHQVKVSNRYSEWIEKAKWWTETCSGFEKAEDACSIILEHAVEEFHARIDRDLQIIQDYFNQSVRSTELKFLSQKEVERRLSVELALHLTALNELKTVPPEETIDAFQTWRLEVDHLREQCFSDALHSIDMLSGEMKPKAKSSENVEPPDSVYRELHAKILELEEKLSVATQKIEQQAESFKKQECLQDLLSLEEAANHLNGDLRLLPEHSDRVQYILEAVVVFRARFQE